MFQCETCLVKYNSEKIFDRHIKKGHKIIKCEKCHLSFINKKSFVQHDKTHVINCEFWFKTFSLKKNLKVHMKRCVKQSQVSNENETDLKKILWNLWCECQETNIYESS